MLFNSFVFIFAFMPVVFVIYFILNKNKLFTASKWWMFLSSLFFYGWWNLIYLPLIMLSIAVNYFFGSLLGKNKPRLNRKFILISGIFFNVALLGYFKYSDFFIRNLNIIFGNRFSLLGLVLPLAISFFTFTQITYLVDAYRSETKEYGFLNYALFVTYFPHLIAGPIVYHKDLVPQFGDWQLKRVDYRNIVLGIFIFFMGLVKKVLIADTFSVWATEGFDNSEILNFTEAWITSLSYTFQLYFDFSGYTDMAIGSSLVFNIKLPVNFYSPYKALNIQEFWKRWNITLTRFLTNYIYIPLGGNRSGEARMHANILIIFLISGFWHGAGWTFVFWGFLHGLATVINKLWQKLNIRMYYALAWLMTFSFVNFAWVFFRAKQWSDAVKVLKGMFGFNGLTLPRSLGGSLSFLKKYGIDFSAINMQDGKKAIVMIVCFLLVVVFLKNSIQFMENFKFNKKYFFFTLFLASVAIIYMTYSGSSSEFLYFNF